MNPDVLADVRELLTATRVLDARLDRLTDSSPAPSLIPALGLPHN